MQTNKLLTVFVFGLGLTLALLWLLESTPAVAAPTASLTVTKLTDSADGVCDNDCSLREAIIAANDNAGADVISLAVAGTYELTIPGANEGAGATGDLDIRDDLTIVGQGPGATIIDANGIDLVLFHITDLDFFGDPAMLCSL
jgi:CSLREA domain-containing protein